MFDNRHNVHDESGLSALLIDGISCHPTIDILKMAFTPLGSPFIFQIYHITLHFLIVFRFIGGYIGFGSWYVR